jgi:integrase
VTKPGRHADGDGLYLAVDASGAKRWLFLFRWRDTRSEPSKLKEMGLGSASKVSLMEARERAAEARKVLASGRNPIAERRAEALAQRAVTTFGAFADEIVASLSQGFRSEKHKHQWRRALSVEAAALRDMPLDEIGTNHILAVLTPIWQTKHETASRVRARIERVIDAAKAKGLRTGENPARWRGHLDKLLSRRRKLTRGHHPAMPYPEVPAFMSRLRERDAISALALEFTILTAARSGEVLGARVTEVDRAARIWTVPAHRMKAGRQHRVPLSARALEILDTVEPIRNGDLLFPGRRSGQPLSARAMDQLLKGIRPGDVTIHGFRSSFRDWAGERTHFSREVAEAALAHQVGDEVERAYRRGDALEKRRELMGAWADYLAIGEQPNVVRLRTG